MESLGAMAVSTSCVSISAPLFSSSSRIARARRIATQPAKSLLSVAPPASSAALSLQRFRMCSIFPVSLSLSGTTTAVPRRRASRNNVITSQASSEDAGAGGIAAIGGGLVANPVVWWSLYTLKTTGCGLPPGPGGSIGAVEGVSYLVIFGVIGWSIYTKVKTGGGLPQGPFGLLGAVEGITYLSLLAIVVVFGLQALDFGFIPGPLPGKECFG